MGARGEGPAGLVEADVSVCADSENLEVNAAGVADRLVVVCCSLIVVTGPHVGAVRGALGEVHAVDKETVDEVRVAFGMVFGQTDVFVKVEGLGLGEGDLACFAAPGQFVIERKRGRSRCEAKNSGGLAREELLDTVGCDDGNIFGGGQDGNPH